jgi:hypothetical protein
MTDGVLVAIKSLFGRRDLRPEEGMQGRETYAQLHGVSALNGPDHGDAEKAIALKLNLRRRAVLLKSGELASS